MKKEKENKEIDVNIYVGAHVTEVAHINNECCQTMILTLTWTRALVTCYPVHVIFSRQTANSKAWFFGPGIRLPRPGCQGIRMQAGLLEQAGYQADEDTAELDNVSVSDGVEAADPGVEDRDQGGADHRGVQLHVYYHRQGGA